MAQRAVLFDLDDTLIADSHDTLVALATAFDGDHDRAMTVAGVALRLWRQPEYGGQLGQRLGIAGTEALFSTFELDHPTVAGPLAAVQPAFAAAVWGEGADRAEAFRAARAAHVTVYDEVADVLTELADGGHRLGLVTNGPTDLQRVKLAASGLDRFFDVVVVSGQLGHGKPSPEPFWRALDELAVAPQQALMVGDSESRDVAGARAAGVPVARLDRQVHDLRTLLDGSRGSTARTSASARS
jgi:HAD superfamily hydrolase (TIGR01549 family)